MQQYWASPEAAPDASKPGWWNHRKDFMGVLAAALMNKLTAPDGLDPAGLARAAMRMLSERHLLLYIPDIQDTLAAQHWDGGLVPYAGDYLMVVDSNVGFNKVNAVVAETIAYTVSLRSDGGADAELRIRYHHGSSASLDACVHEARYGRVYADMMDRCYWDYLRVYVPASTTLTGSEGLEDVGPADAEAGRAVFQGYFVLPPGQEREVVLRFRDASISGAYSVYVQKQPGTSSIPLTVTVQGQDGSRRVWTTDLSMDREFTPK
jgi:hypothetical protein